MVIPSSPRSNNALPRPTSPLMVDELDYYNNNHSGCARNVVGVDKVKSALTGHQQQKQKQKQNGAKTLGPVDFASLAPCPCCARYVVKDLDGSVGTSKQQQQQQQQQEQERQPPSLTASPSKDDDRKDAALPGSLDPTNTTYAVQSIAVQGWVHKKGTGNDLFGSRGWKSRWATLCTATVPGYDVDIPLLVISWFPHSDTPSNVLVLDPSRTVVMPVDRYPTEDKVVQWNTFTFEIVHSGDGGASPTTRVFSVPEQERSEWVCAIQQCLREYGQRLQRKNRDSPDLLLPPLSPRSSIKLCCESKSIDYEK